MIMSAEAFWLWVASAFVVGVVGGYGVFWAVSLAKENKRLRQVMSVTNPPEFRGALSKGGVTEAEKAVEALQALASSRRN